MMEMIKKYKGTSVSYTHLDVYKRQLENREYTGCLVNFKTEKLSYKVKHLSLIHIYYMLVYKKAYDLFCINFKNKYVLDTLRQLPDFRCV